MASKKGHASGSDRGQAYTMSNAVRMSVASSGMTLLSTGLSSDGRLDRTICAHQSRWSPLAISTSHLPSRSWPSPPPPPPSSSPFIMLLARPALSSSTDS